MDVLKKPFITEKVSSATERGVYGFFVDVNANKVEIKKCIEEMYSVSVEKVHTMRYMGKKKVRHTKSGVSRGKKAAYKKALVSLKEGEVIDFYASV